MEAIPLIARGGLERGLTQSDYWSSQIYRRFGAREIDALPAYLDALEKLEYSALRGLVGLASRRQVAAQALSVVLNQSLMPRRWTIADLLGEELRLARHVLPQLIEVLTDPAFAVRRCACRTLGGLAPYLDQPPSELIDRLQDTDVGTASIAAQSLGKFGVRAHGAVTDLLAVLNREGVGPHAALSLARIAADGNAPEVVETLRSELAHSRSWRAWYSPLGFVWDKGTGWVIEKDGFTDLELQQILDLRNVEDEWIQSLTTASQSVRVLATRGVVARFPALSKETQSRAIDALVESLDAEDDRVDHGLPSWPTNVTAAWALSRLGRAAIDRVRTELAVGFPSLSDGKLNGLSLALAWMGSEGASARSVLRSVYDKLVAAISRDDFADDFEKEGVLTSHLYLLYALKKTDPEENLVPEFLQVLRRENLYATHYSVFRPNYSDDEISELEEWLIDEFGSEIRSYLPEIRRLDDVERNEWNALAASRLIAPFEHHCAGDDMGFEFIERVRAGLMRGSPASRVATVRWLLLEREVGEEYFDREWDVPGALAPLGEELVDLSPYFEKRLRSILYHENSEALRSLVLVARYDPNLAASLVRASESPELIESQNIVIDAALDAPEVFAPFPSWVAEFLHSTVPSARVNAAAIRLTAGDKSNQDIVTQFLRDVANRPRSTRVEPTTGTWASSLRWTPEPDWQKDLRLARRLLSVLGRAPGATALVPEFERFLKLEDPWFRVLAVRAIWEATGEVRKAALLSAMTELHDGFWPYTSMRCEGLNRERATLEAIDLLDRIADVELIRSKELQRLIAYPSPIGPKAREVSQRHRPQ
ncbi:MAG: hypothetical protein AAF517_15255 [Planctomycetota bacterium]